MLGENPLYQTLGLIAQSDLEIGVSPTDQSRTIGPWRVQDCPANILEANKLSYMVC